MVGPDVRRPQMGHEQSRAAGDVQRQEAVVVVVAVEEVLLLVAVDRVVGGVDVEDEFGGRRLERGEELVDEDQAMRRRSARPMRFSSRQSVGAEASSAEPSTSGWSVAACQSGSRRRRPWSLRSS